MPPRIINALFLLLVFGLPLGQVGFELSRGEPVQALDVFGPIEASRLRAFEQGLRESSFVHREVTPWYRWLLLETFGRGNEKSIVGADDWLFLGENLDYVTRPLFEPSGERAIRDAIEDFARQLEERGVALVIVPAAAKVAIEPRHLSCWTRDLDGAEHAAVRGFLASLEGVALWPEVWDPPASPKLDFLPRDTHWTPACMQESAKGVAERVREVLAARGSRLEREAHWKTEAEPVSGRGDLTDLLRLPEGVTPYEPMELELERVVDAETGEPFAPDRDAEVLLLGDSFTLVFSDERLAMGEHAGFAEHLALELGTPLDVIALAGGSARAVREALARREDGLAGKKVVVWQLLLRDFVGDPSKWTRVELPAGREVTAVAAGPVKVRAEIVEVTRIPEEFDYELCLAVYEYRVLEALEGTVPPGPLWVAQLAIVDYEPTSQAAYRAGEVQTLTLEDVALHYDLESTSWMDQTDSDPRATIWFPTAIEEGGR